ncbi:hypothetical protein Mapa_014011 [Marchantia paleacea]|nr:hypothetical protein Mapa_014011 [Marchantia paleacea]
MKCHLALRRNWHPRVSVSQQCLRDRNPNTRVKLCLLLHGVHLASELVHITEHKLPDILERTSGDGRLGIPVKYPEIND